VLVIICFNALRQLENWLHQHIFKVGWLLTKNYQTTTIFYYTFFLPGVVVYEVVYWLAAGALNVRAERAVAMPEKQEVGELRLNFVKLSKKAPAYKINIINAAPLIVGIVLIWLIVTKIIDLNGAFQQANSGTLDDISRVIKHLTTTPDFWLWTYLVFTIGNTMMPDATILKAWRWVIWPIAGIVIFLFALGIGEEVMGQAISGPVTNGLNVLSTAFAFIVVLDVLAVGILGGIESLVERLTGDSATFKNGKMITMTRAEAIAEREKERQRTRQTQKQPTTAPALQGGTPSIYKLPFPIPGAPGQEPVSRQAAVIVEPEKPPMLPGQQQPKRIEPTIITGEVVGKPAAPPSPPPRPMPVFGGTAALRTIENDKKEKEDEPLEDEAIEDDYIEDEVVDDIREYDEDALEDDDEIEDEDEENLDEDAEDSGTIIYEDAEDSV